jgi:hypothetical protein
MPSAAHPAQVQHGSTKVLLSFLASGNCRWQEKTSHPLCGWSLIQRIPIGFRFENLKPCGIADLTASAASEAVAHI